MAFKKDAAEAGEMVGAEGVLSLYSFTLLMIWEAYHTLRVKGNITAKTLENFSVPEVHILPGKVDNKQANR